MTSFTKETFLEGIIDATVFARRVTTKRFRLFGAKTVHQMTDDAVKSFITTGDFPVDDACKIVLAKDYMVTDPISNIRLPLSVYLLVCRDIYAVAFNDD